MEYITDYVIFQDKSSYFKIYFHYGKKIVDIGSCYDI